MAGRLASLYSLLVILHVLQICSSSCSLAAIVQQDPFTASLCTRSTHSLPTSLPQSVSSPSTSYGIPPITPSSLPNLSMTASFGMPSSSSPPFNFATAICIDPQTPSVSSGSVSSPSPTQSVDPATLRDIETIRNHRLSNIVSAIGGDGHIYISAWLSTLGQDGKWPDSEVDYTTGCAARRANWPSQKHWKRILAMCGAWHGGLDGMEQYVKNEGLRKSISRAMNYWFSKDFINPAYLDLGGTALCPCSSSDKSFWNRNWFSNIILIPELVSQSCLLLGGTLAQSELSNCTHITDRSYQTFDRNIHGIGFLTGSNTLDVAKIGIDQALLTANESLIADAYRRIHEELIIRDDVRADGIRPDGSFGQHKGVLYNGNYGKDFTNDVLDLETEAGDSRFSADADSQTAFATLFDGDRWMIYRNVLTDVLHWDFSALGRFISFPVIDKQATASINMNLTEVGVLGKQWNSSTLIDFAASLQSSTDNANAGKLIGNRLFYDNDYMVNRGSNYVSTLKMYSTRTKNTECTNSQNPLGFHLSDGALYTYLTGNEYEDISAAWDWNLIPGITLDYNVTYLDCAHTGFTGMEDFVGGASNGEIGIAAMRYTNPLTNSLHWQKAWFFLPDDVQHVMVANMSSTTDNPVFSVLDQRRHSGIVIVDGQVQRNISDAHIRSLWHGHVGYLFDNTSDAHSVSFIVENKTGDWSLIGTSTQPPATIDLFAAWIEHKSLDTPISYSVFPGTSPAAFSTKTAQLRLQPIRNDNEVSAIYDDKHRVVMAVFWNLSGGTVSIAPSIPALWTTVTVDGNMVLIYKIDEGEVVVSDPSQKLTSGKVTFSNAWSRRSSRWPQDMDKELIFEFPSGEFAGSSVVLNLNDDMN